MTVDQIRQARSKVKSDADFPVYIKDLKNLCVIYYGTFVSGGHSGYFDDNKNKAIVLAKFEALLSIAEVGDSAQFKARLKARQQEQSDYLTFIEEYANFGIDKWVVSMQKMTCAY